MLKEASCNFLRQHYLFSKLSDEHFQQVAEYSLQLSLQKDEALFSQGDPVERFYVV